MYAAGEEVTGITTALGIDTAENPAADKPLLDAPSEEGASASPVVIPEPAPPPIISGESTNNAQIETTPTPQKDNDIRQRIQGIFSEIEGLQAVNVSVTQGVVTLTGETPNEKKGATSHQFDQPSDRCRHCRRSN